MRTRQIDKIEYKNKDLKQKSNILNQNIIYLKKKLALKIFEEDHLINYTCKQIEQDYIMKFGVYEYKIEEYKLKIAKTKRKIELINKKLGKQKNSKIETKQKANEENRKKINETKINKPQINMIFIEKHIRKEFEKEELELKEKIAKTTVTIEKFKAGKQEKRDYKEINTTYKDCIKRAHPDLLINHTDYIESLYFNAKEAYEDKDLDELKAVQGLIQSYKKRKPEKLESKTAEELEEFKKLLKIRIKLTDKEISQITNKQPYNQQDFLIDTKRVNQYKAELAEELLNSEKEYAKYKKELNELKVGNNLSFKL